MRRIAFLCVIAAAPLLQPAALFAASPDWGALELEERRIEPGEKAKFSNGTEPSFEGAFLDFPIFAARSVRPGPALCVTSGIHGDELNSVEFARRAFAAVDAQQLAGSAARRQQLGLPHRRPLPPGSA